MTAADTLLERVLLASLLQAPGQQFQKSCRRVLDFAPEEFNSPECGKIAVAIRQASANGHVPNILAVGKELSLELAGELQKLADESRSAISLDQLEYDVEPWLRTILGKKAVAELGTAWQEAKDDPSKFLSVATRVSERLQSFIAEMPLRPEDLPAMVDAADFLQSTIEQPRELIQGVLHQGSKLVLGGASKSFKTWTLLDLAISVSHGLHWLGFSTTKGRVLYVNFEIQNAPWQKRLAAVARAKSLQIRPGAVTLWNLRGKAADFRSLLPQIAVRAKRENFSIIILDPIYKLYGTTDENKAGDVAALLNGIEALAVEAGAAVAFGAHFSKGNQAGKEAIDRISGSGVFARDPDSILVFTAHEEPNAFTVEPILRNFPQVDPFAVRFDFPLMHRDEELDPSRLKQSNAGRRREYDPRKILKAITGTSVAKPISISAWAHAAGIPRQTLTDYLPELRQQGFIGTAGEGSTARQYITGKGQEFVRGGA